MFTTLQRSKIALLEWRAKEDKHPVRKVYTLSPLLFSMYDEEAMKEINEILLMTTDQGGK